MREHWGIGTSVYSAHTLAMLTNACHYEDSVGHKIVLRDSQGIPAINTLAGNLDTILMLLSA